MSNKVDILVLAHNSLDVTKQFVQLLCAHTVSFDLYLLDNGSIDGTKEWMLSGEVTKQFPMRCRYLPSFAKTNLGVIGGRNELYRQWTFYDHDWQDNAEYICILDNDQFVQAGWFEQHLSVLEQGKDLVGVEAWQMNKDFRPIHRNTNKSQAFNYVGCGGMLMKAEVPKKIGLFDPLFDPAYFEDPDFCFRAHDAGYKIGWNYKAKITHLAHSTLGKTDWKTKFQVSHEKFKQKWKDKTMPLFKQEAIND